MRGGSRKEATEQVTRRLAPPGLPPPLHLQRRVPELLTGQSREGTSIIIIRILVYLGIPTDSQALPVTLPRHEYGRKKWYEDVKQKCSPSSNTLTHTLTT